LKTVRFFFRKEGSTVYISHLDTTRFLSRVIKRSGIPVWYTEGFNPHIYLTFAQPLPLGCGSVCESFDLRITDDNADPADLARRLNEASSPDLPIFAAGEATFAPADIFYSAYRFTFTTSVPEGLTEQIQAFLTRKSVPAEKKTKRGTKAIDIALLSADPKISVEPDGVILEILLSSGVEDTLSPILYRSILGEACGIQPECGRILRTAMLNQSKTILTPVL